MWGFRYPVCIINKLSSFVIRDSGEITVLKNLMINLKFKAITRAYQGSAFGD